MPICEDSQKAFNTSSPWFQELAPKPLRKLSRDCCDISNQPQTKRAGPKSFASATITRSTGQGACTFKNQTAGPHCWQFLRFRLQRTPIHPITENEHPSHLNQLMMIPRRQNGSKIKPSLHSAENSPNFLVSLVNFNRKLHQQFIKAFKVASSSISPRTKRVEEPNSCKYFLNFYFFQERKAFLSPQRSR